MSEPVEKPLEKPASLLDGIQSPADLKKLGREELPRLAEELRAEIIRVVSRNGGHLASSLGAVELICALHYVFDLPRDQIVFDVGHQTYAHKLLTGRREAFENLRREDGLSGFPKREESDCDVFDTGHASTSISAALGLAAARDMMGLAHNVAAVIGDGALTGGLALEALNHAGDLQKGLLVILNDNSMSIGPNVGGLAGYLSLRFTAPGHVQLRERVKGLLKQLMPQFGEQVISGVQKIEESIKSFLNTPSTFFEALGFKYVGPLDGHDFNVLIDALQNLKQMNRPVLLHLITTKGKGYAPAEHDPCGFHGVAAKRAECVREPDDSHEALPPSGASKAKNYTDVFGEFMLEAAENDSRVCAITAAMGQGTGLSAFFERYPQRAFDVGIAEEHAVTFAAGLAAAGFRPVAAIYSTFLQRAFDQVFHDVALQNLPVLFAIDRAGLVGEDGPTHHGALDISYLRLMPNLRLMAPKDEHELRAMLQLALRLPGPSAVRYPRGEVTGRPAPAEPAPLEPGRGERVMGGRDISIMALGATFWPAWEAAQRLEAEGVSVSLVNPRFIKPLDEDLLLTEASFCGRVLTVEENSIAGGFGEMAAALMLRRGLSPKLRLLGLPDEPIPQATPSSQRTRLSLDAAGIYGAARSLLA